MFYKAFIAHPETLGESYTEHQRAALSYAGTLLVAGLAAAVHAMVPCLFETTASRRVAALHARMAARHALATREVAAMQATATCEAA